MSRLLMQASRHETPDSFTRRDSASRRRVGCGTRVSQSEKRVTAKKCGSDVSLSRGSDAGDKQTISCGDDL